MTLTGKTVLITGGARRVGATICRCFHQNGANIMLHYRSSQGEAHLLQSELNQKRANSVTLIQADLLNVATIPNLVQETLRCYGQLDVVINNASSFFPTKIGEINEENWDDLIGSNLKAPLFLAQAAAPALKKTHGCIINITDIHAERPMKNYIVYSIAKAGLVGLTRTLARELAPEIRVNGVAPGPILWPEDNFHFDDLSQQRIINHTLLKRVGTPDDIAETVYFLVAHSPYITGQNIAVDGGRSVKL